MFDIWTMSVGRSRLFIFFESGDLTGDTFLRGFSVTVTFESFASSFLPGGVIISARFRLHSFGVVTSNISSWVSITNSCVVIIFALIDCFREIYYLVIHVLFVRCGSHMICLI